MIGAFFLRGLDAYVALSLKRPILVVAFNSVVLFALATITVLTGQLETVSYGGVEWLVKTDVSTRRWFGAQSVSRDATEWWDSEDTTSSEGIRSARAYPVTFIYSTSGENVFVPQVLESIRKLENILAADPSYTSSCALDYGEDEPGAPPVAANSTSVQCQPPLSVLTPFYGLPVPGTGYPEISWNQTGIDAILSSLSDNLFLYGGFFDKSFEADNLSSKWTRSVYHLGMPLQGFRSSSVQYFEQLELVGEALGSIDETISDAIGQKKKFMRTLLSQAGSLPLADGEATSAPDVEVLYHHQVLEDKEFEAVVQTDLLWSVLSFTGVFAYSVFHTRSFLVAATGMFCSTLSYPTALLIYRAIFRVAYYDSLNTLVLFIMLGIGADTIFVYFDAFRQSLLLPEHCESRESRLLYTVRRAASATLVTSLTTALAFLATALSRMVPIAAFGIFAFTCMVVLYVTSTTMIPPVLVIWDKYFSMLPFCVCSKHCPCVNASKVDELTTARSNAASHRSQFGQTVEIESSSGDGGANSTSSKDRDPFTHASADAATTDDPVDIEQYSRSEQFFGTTYFRWIYKARWPIVVLFITAMGFGSYLALSIAPPVDVEKLFPQSHVLTKFADALDTRNGPFRLSQEDSTTPIDVVLGLNPPFLDQTGISRWLADENGELLFDGQLHTLFSSSSGRQWLMDVCGTLSNAACNAEACDPVLSGNSTAREDDRTLVRREDDGVTPQATCWTKDLQEWMSENGRGSFVNTPDDNVTAVLQEFLSERVDLRGDLLFSSSNTTDGSGTPQNSKVLAALWHFSSTFVEPQSQRKTEGVMNAWASTVSDLARTAPGRPVGGMYSTGRYAWAWLIAQQELVKSALSGMGLSFAMAFVVLNMSTGNLYMAFLSTFTVAGIVATSLGLGVVGIMKWPLGISESISVVILIGFSMDYCLHLADAYMKAGGSRVSRTRQSLLELGVSVFAGANTTNLAGLPLWLGTMVFFNKFAFLINMTIVSALFWSLVFFPAACSIIGPEGQAGNWSYILSFLSRPFTSRKSDPVSPDSSMPVEKAGTQAP